MGIVALVLALISAAGAAPAASPDERAEAPSERPPTTQAPTTQADTERADPDSAIEFGDDGGGWAHDGECDDRRFTGEGMAADLDWSDAGRDATDCRRGVEGGLLTLWDERTAREATRCDLIDFGDDGGAWPRDGECDDPRFEGRAVAAFVAEADRGADATDCRRLCELGVIALRDYRAY